MNWPVVQALSPYLSGSLFGKESFFPFRKLSTKILIPDKESFGNFW